MRENQRRGSAIKGGMEKKWLVAIALACMVQVIMSGGAPHPEGVRDMTQKWAESRVSELSRQAKAAAIARGQKEPGTFLLTMIVKNEAKRLDRSLPVWAPLIDAWVIGVDRNNTDNTEEVIKKHLGGVPGEILIVDFDGMGPTWTKVVQHGQKKYPDVTHGILSDADFTPLPETMSKWDLDRSCSKLLFTVLEADGTGTKVMDWIYRNIPGARVERRTHQILLVPPTSENQMDYQRQIGFTVKEFTGGYQDRAGNKSGRYIDWLLKDLEELPGDARTIYYLGKEHMELAGENPIPDLRSNPQGPAAYHLYKSMEYYKIRSDMDVWVSVKGIDEERYWSMLKVAEMCERWLFNSTCCLEYWHRAWELDPPRADAPFYIGQHYRLLRDGANAVKFLRKTIALDMPTRNNYQWPYLYYCLRHMELVRAASGMTHPFYISGGAWRDIKASYAHALGEVLANCPADDTSTLAPIWSQAEARRERSRLEKRAKAAKEGGANKQERVAPSAAQKQAQQEQAERQPKQKSAATRERRQAQQEKEAKTEPERAAVKTEPERAASFQQESPHSEQQKSPHSTFKMVDENGNLVDVPHDEL